MRHDQDTYTFLKWTSAGFIALVLLGLLFKPEAAQNVEKKRYRVPNISGLIERVDKTEEVKSTEAMDSSPSTNYDFVIH
ncbi:MAG: hypothetical protein AAF487_00590 [Bacteroidota bacterium]